MLIRKNLDKGDSIEKLQIVLEHKFDKIKCADDVLRIRDMIFKHKILKMK